VKLIGVMIRLAEKTPSGLTMPDVCWVRGCPSIPEYCCNLEMTHPDIPNVRQETVLLCSDHADGTAQGTVGWDWHRLRDQRIVFIPFGYERHL
jgi:hypothetical protein